VPIILSCGEIDKERVSRISEGIGKSNILICL